LNSETSDARETRPLVNRGSADRRAGWRHRAGADHAGPAARRRPSARPSYHAIGWTEGGVSYWAVSDVGERELENFVTLFRAAPTNG